MKSCIEKKECNKCGRLITKINYNRHFNSCKGIKKDLSINDFLIENGKYQCPHCFKFYSKYGIKTHIWRSHGNGKDFKLSNLPFGDSHWTRKPEYAELLKDKTEKSQLTLKQKYPNGIGFFSKDYHGTEKHLAAASLGGKNSASKQIRRSKNEIHFTSLCKEFFLNVKENEKIFNGWDADTIIKDLKIAVLWNGIWHYKQCNKRHDVKKVQERDNEKIKSIVECGYIPYIIQDMGKENKEFVILEFEKFKEFCAGIAQR